MKMQNPNYLRKNYLNLFIYIHFEKFVVRIFLKIFLKNPLFKIYSGKKKTYSV